MLAAKTACMTHADVSEHVWVQVGDKKGKTGSCPAMVEHGGVDRNAAKIVTFEDGSTDFPSADKITILPQAHSSVLELIFKKAASRDQEQWSKDALLERIKSCEEADRSINGELKCSFRGGS